MWKQIKHQVTCPGMQSLKKVRLDFKPCPRVHTLNHYAREFLMSLDSGQTESPEGPSLSLIPTGLVSNSHSCCFG